eukprot:ctg_606.g193
MSAPRLAAAAAVDEHRLNDAWPLYPSVPGKRRSRTAWDVGAQHCIAWRRWGQRHVAAAAAAAVGGDGVVGTLRGYQGAAVSFGVAERRTGAASKLRPVGHATPAPGTAASSPPGQPRARRERSGVSSRGCASRFRARLARLQIVRLGSRRAAPAEPHAQRLDERHRSDDDRRAGHAVPDGYDGRVRRGARLSGQRTAFVRQTAGQGGVGVRGEHSGDGRSDVRLPPQRRSGVSAQGRGAGAPAVRRIPSAPTAGHATPLLLVYPATAFAARRPVAVPVGQSGLFERMRLAAAGVARARRCHRRPFAAAVGRAR